MTSLLNKAEGLERGELAEWIDELIQAAHSDKPDSFDAPWLVCSVADMLMRYVPARSTMSSTTQTPDHFLIIVMGVCGTGKSTLGSGLAQSLDVPYIDGDDLHPPSSVAKMARGEPLNDGDREPWLAVIRAEAVRITTLNPKGGVVIACSALKRYYRDIIRGKNTSDRSNLRASFVYIHGTRPFILKRMEARVGHFMKPAMLDSQLAILENPEGEENVVVVPLELTAEEQVELARQGLGM